MSYFQDLMYLHEGKEASLFCYLPKLLELRMETEVIFEILSVMANYFDLKICL